MSTPISAVSSSTPAIRSIAPTAKPAGTFSATAASAATMKPDSFFSSSDMSGTAGMLGRAAIAGNVAYQGGAQALGGLQGVWTAFKSFDLNALFTSTKALGQTALSWGGKAGGMQAAISLAVNGYRALNHQESWGTAGTNVVMDGATGVVSGAAGAIAGGLGTMLLGLVGLAGGPLTIAAAVVGMGGYYLADTAIRHSSLYQRVRSGVAGVFGEATRPLNV